MTEKEENKSKASVCTKTISTDNFFAIDISYKLINTNLIIFIFYQYKKIVRTYLGWESVI